MSMLRIAQVPPVSSSNDITLDVPKTAEATQAQTSASEGKQVQRGSAVFEKAVHEGCIRRNPNGVQKDLETIVNKCLPQGFTKPPKGPRPGRAVSFWARRAFPNEDKKD